MYNRLNQREIPSDWLKIAKDQIKSSTKKRLYQRFDKLQEVINRLLEQRTNLPQFRIDDSLKEQISQQVLYVIDQYHGHKTKKDKFPKSEDEVIKKSRTWWNRVKSAKLASLLFLAICFYVLHNFLEDQYRTLLNPVQRLTLFIDIFIGFMEELIKFPKTRPKPLIPHQCFLTESNFKDLCASFIQIFGDKDITWNCDIKRVGVHIENGKKSYKYIKHKNRSQELFEAFSKCLIDIKSKLMINGNDDEFLINYQKWTQTIDKFKPKQYSLSFRSHPLSFVPVAPNNNIMYSNTMNLSHHNQPNQQITRNAYHGFDNRTTPTHGHDDYNNNIGNNLYNYEVIDNRNPAPDSDSFTTFTSSSIQPSLQGQDPQRASCCQHCSHCKSNISQQQVERITVPQQQPLCVNNNQREFQSMGGFNAQLNNGHAHIGNRYKYRRSMEREQHIQNIRNRTSINDNYVINNGHDMNNAFNFPSTVSHDQNEFVSFEPKQCETVFYPDTLTMNGEESLSIQHHHGFNECDMSTMNHNYSQSDLDSINMVNYDDRSSFSYGFIHGGDNQTINFQPAF